MLWPAFAVHAQQNNKTDAMRAAIEEVQSLSFILSTYKQCPQLRAVAAAAPVVNSVQKDALGRIISGQYSNGTDFVLEYKGRGSTPIAVTSNGRRAELAQSDVKVGQAQMMARQLEAAKAKALIYRKVREICDIPPVALPKVGETNIMVSGGGSCGWMDPETGFCIGGGEGGGGGDGFPDEWYDAGFWEGTWSMNYAGFSAPPVIDPACMAACVGFCDSVAFDIGIGCTFLTFVPTPIGPFGGALLAAACQLGSQRGKNYCQGTSCLEKCTR
jgi:hypothetical protein